MHVQQLILFVLLTVTAAHGFPGFKRVDLPGAQPLPPPTTDKSSKLVNDAAHLYQPPGSGDQRGPCPGLNTLANHGYLPRTGVATPGQILMAVQEGFNMGFDLASFVTMAAFIVDGNHESNLLSIGGKTPLTGPDPPAPAVVGGLNMHALFEGDASTTRSDAALGNNHDFNATLFEQLAEAAVTYGGGKITFGAMAEHRYNRIVDSINRNPTFDLSNPRYLTVYAESAFPLRMWVNGTSGYAGGGSFPSLGVKVALGFFRDGQMPDGFFRREGDYGLSDVAADTQVLKAPHPVPAGKNNGAGNYVPDPVPPSICDAYAIQVGHVVDMYPPATTTGSLRAAVKANLNTFYQVLPGAGPKCPQLFPYGQ